MSKLEQNNIQLNKEICLTNIEKCLDSLSSTTNWIIGSLIVIAFTDAATANGQFEVFGSKIPAKEAGLAMFIFVFGLNFYIYKLSRKVFYYYDSIDEKDRIEARTIMSTHIWIC